MERLTAEQFIEKLKTAAEWSIGVNIAGRELELYVREDGVPKMMLGPDPLLMDMTDLKAFFKQVGILSSKPRVRLTPEEFSEKMRASEGNFVVEEDEEGDFLLRVPEEGSISTYLGPEPSFDMRSWFGKDYVYLMDILEQVESRKK